MCLTGYPTTQTQSYTTHPSCSAIHNVNIELLNFSNLAKWERVHIFFTAIEYHFLYMFF